MTGYTYKTHYRCKSCGKWFKHEECEIYKSSKPAGMSWPICPSGTCGKYQLQKRAHNKRWKTYHDRTSPSKEPGKMLRAMEVIRLEREKRERERQKQNLQK